MALIFKLINFVIFVGLLAYFLRKPIAAFWLDRQKSHSDTITTAKNSYENIKAEELSLAERLKGLPSEIKAITDEIKTEGELERLRIVEQSKRYATQIEENAMLTANYEKGVAVQKLKAFIGTEALELAKAEIMKDISGNLGLIEVERSAEAIEANI